MGVVMAKLSRDSLVKSLFSDPKNYPYGFSRSGDFSISESKALAQYGCLISALVDGQIDASTEEDDSLLATAFGHKDPETVAERAWLKYQKRINRPKAGSVYGNHHAVVADSDEEVSEHDGTIDVEIDED